MVLQFNARKNKNPKQLSVDLRKYENKNSQNPSMWKTFLRVNLKPNVGLKMQTATCSFLTVMPEQCLHRHCWNVLHANTTRHCTWEQRSYATIFHLSIPCFTAMTDVLCPGWTVFCCNRGQRSLKTEMHNWQGALVAIMQFFLNTSGITWLGWKSVKFKCLKVLITCCSIWTWN